MTYVVYYRCHIPDLPLLKQRRADSHARRASLSTLLRWALAECGKPPASWFPSSQHGITSRSLDGPRFVFPSQYRGLLGRTATNAAGARGRSRAHARPHLLGRELALPVVQVTTALTRVRRCRSRPLSRVCDSASLFQSAYPEDRGYGVSLDILSCHLRIFSADASVRSSARFLTELCVSLA